MTIPKVKKQDIIKALEFIDENGVPEHNTIVKYVLTSEDEKKYPPKYVIAVANIWQMAQIFQRILLEATTLRTYWKVLGLRSRKSNKKNIGCPLLPKAWSQRMNALQWII